MNINLEKIQKAVRHFISNDLKKKLVITGCAMATLATAFFGARYGMKTVAAKEIQIIKEEVIVKAQEDVMSYVTDYATEYGIMTNEPVEVDLTEEQMESITNSVSEVVTTELITDVVTSPNVISEESLEVIKTVVSQEVIETLSDSDVSIELTDKEEEVVVSTVSTIVKKDLLNVLNEHDAGNEENLLAIKTSLDADIAKIQETLKDYGEEIEGLQKAIKNVDTESANEIQTLLEKYNAVVKEYTAITKDVTLLQEHLSKDVSTNIEDVKQMITQNSELITSNVEDITNSLTILNDKVIELKSSVTGMEDTLNLEIQNVNSALLSYTDNVTEETKLALLAQIQNTQAVLQNSIDTSKGSQQEALKVVYEELNKAQELLATEEDLSTLQTQFVISTEKINNSLNAAGDRISINTETIQTLSSTLDDTNIAVDALSIALTEQESATNLSLARLEESMQNSLDKAIANSVSENNLTNEKINTLDSTITTKLNNLDAAINTLNTTVSNLNANTMTYDNTNSGLTSTTLQGAIDEIKSKTDETSSSFTEFEQNLTDDFTELEQNITDDFSELENNLTNNFTGLTEGVNNNFTELEKDLIDLLDTAIFIESFDEENGILYLEDYEGMTD